MSAGPTSQAAAPAATARIARAFAGGRKAFVPYITAGDPDLETTAALVRLLERAGADAIELGVPFSDPIADGPVNQRAAERAIRAGTTLASVIDLAASLRADGVEAALVLFTYVNPVLAFGVERFAAAAAAAGVDGVLVTDLPVDEAVDSGYEAALRGRALDRIYLATPTTTEARLRKVREAGSGFLYYVSRTGVTGARDALPETLPVEVARARRQVERPVAVGFGISTPAQAAEVARVADGVVVGSAIVERVERLGRGALEDVSVFARALAEAVHGAAAAGPPAP